MVFSRSIFLTQRAQRLAQRAQRIDEDSAYLCVKKTYQQQLTNPFKLTLSVIDDPIEKLLLELSQEKRQFLKD